MRPPAVSQAHAARRAFRDAEKKVEQALAQHAHTIEMSSRRDASAAAADAEQRLVEVLSPK